MANEEPHSSAQPQAAVPAPTATAKGRNAAIFCIANLKGGVGKSTMTGHLAHGLVERGRKVLVVDLDKSANLTMNYGVDPAGCFGAYEVMMKIEKVKDVIVTNDEDDVEVPENLHLLAGHEKLQFLEAELRQTTRFPNPLMLLRPHLEAVRKDYDYILIDTPPETSIHVAAGYMAADFLLLTAQPEPRAIDGLNASATDLVDAREQGAHIKLFGVSIGMVDKRTRLTRTLVNYVRTAFTDDNGKCWMMEPLIPRSTIIPSAQGAGKTIFETRPTHKVTQIFRDFAENVEERLAELGWNQDDKKLIPFIPSKEKRETARQAIAADLANDEEVSTEAGASRLVEDEIAASDGAVSKDVVHG